MTANTPSTHIDSAEKHWLNLGSANVTPEVAASFEAAIKKFGSVGYGKELTAHKPAILLAQDALSKAVNRDVNSGLSLQERELIAVVVSAENRCESCLATHSALLAEVSGDRYWADRVRVEYTRASLTTRERALADYARHITRNATSISKQDLEPLRQAGLNEIDILEAAAISAYFNFSNRLSSALGVSPTRSNP